jgi:hypothetical protein
MPRTLSFLSRERGDPAHRGWVSLRPETIDGATIAHHLAGGSPCAVTL